MIEKNFETAVDRRVVHYEGDAVSDVCRSPVAAELSGFHWVPIAETRMVDIPVQGSDGNTYYVTPFDLSLDRQIKHLLTVRPKAGPRCTTRAQVEKAIERLRAFAAEIRE